MIDFNISIKLIYRMSRTLFGWFHRTSWIIRLL